MEGAPVVDEPTSISPRSRFRAAMILAIAADALQICVFPLFAEVALSPEARLVFVPDIEF